jgi:MoxR-like ATPase
MAATAVPVQSRGDLVLADPASPVATVPAAPQILVPATLSTTLDSRPLNLSPLAGPLAKIAQIEAWLGTELIEREEATRVALTALLSGQHAAFIGPPGTAKSLLILLLAQAFDLSKFITLCSPHSKLEDLMGPLRLSQLPHDIYERLTNAYMPASQLVFLDEVFNLSGSLAQTTHRLMNEREFDNGNRTERAPLISVFGASNQIPQTPDSAAFLDRFSFRLWLGYVSRTNFPRLMALYANRPSSAVLRVLAHNMPIFASQHGLLTLAPPPVTLGQDELFSLMWAAAHIPIPQSILSTLDKLYDDLAGKGIYVSDRRWRQSQDALRVNALLDGRGIVTTDDIAVHANMFWTTREQRVTISQIVERLGNPLAVAAVDKRDQAKTAYDAAIAAQADLDLDAGKRMSATVEALGKLKETAQRLEALLAQAQQQAMNPTKIQRALDAVQGWRKELSEYVL